MKNSKKEVADLMRSAHQIATAITCGRATEGDLLTHLVLIPTLEEELVPKYYLGEHLFDRVAEEVKKDGMDSRWFDLAVLVNNGTLLEDRVYEVVGEETDPQLGYEEISGENLLIEAYQTLLEN